jgi:hypothetical protein
MTYGIYKIMCSDIKGVEGNHISSGNKFKMTVLNMLPVFI